MENLINSGLTVIKDGQAIYLESPQNRHMAELELIECGYVYQSFTRYYDAYMDQWHGIIVHSAKDCQFHGFVKITIGNTVNENAVQISNSKSYYCEILKTKKSQHSFIEVWFHNVACKFYIVKFKKNWIKVIS